VELALTMLKSNIRPYKTGIQERGKGGVFNFVTKEESVRKCKNLMDVETGSACNLKYPSVILKGDNSVGEFYSIAVTNNFQQADTGTTHLGKILHQLLFLKESLLDSSKRLSV
jgi:Fe-S cluster assembly scaffold protein SufB